MARKKQVIDLETYNALDAWAIALNEMYKALRRAGFAVDMALGIIMERDAYPDWILPNLPNKIDPLPYEDEDED
jgi:cytolysin (calcineurin-like family phosphatase)